jgi:hypothetical protein
LLGSGCAPGGSCQKNARCCLQNCLRWRPDFANQKCKLQQVCEAASVQFRMLATYVRFIRVCLEYPSPSTFLHAVTAGFITGPDQFPRLTTKMVRKKLPNALATAKGHLDRTRSNPPPGYSDAVSARRRHHTMATRKPKAAKKPDHSPELFSPRDGPRSATLHLDYTGPLPEAYSAGTRYFQISCHGGYINTQPFLSLRHEHTTVALRRTVEFFREHGAIINRIRMDNQQSNPYLLMAKQPIRLSNGTSCPHMSRTPTGWKEPSAPPRTT